MKVEIKVFDKRLDPLAYATPGAAAVDLRACSVYDDAGKISSPLVDSSLVILPGHRIKIGTGIAVHLGSAKWDEFPMCDLHTSIASLLLPRSGAGWKGFELANTVGLIDSDYQGELILAAKNGGTGPIAINPMERMAQMLIIPVLRPEYSVVTSFSSETARGDGGFGSTGAA